METNRNTYDGRSWLNVAWISSIAFSMRVEYFVQITPAKSNYWETPLGNNGFPIVLSTERIVLLASLTKILSLS
jgi:hypothetical protein